MRLELDTFVNNLQSIETVEAGRSLLADTLMDMGFEQFAYLGMRLPETSLAEPVLVHTFDSDWIERYVEHDYANFDPVVEKGLGSLIPFTWGHTEQQSCLDKDSRKVMNEAEEFGLHRGLTVPIHGAGGELAVLSVALPKSRKEAASSIKEYKDIIHLMSLNFHAHLGHKIFSEGLSKQVELSKRECECLLWSAEGKTAWETSEILCISDHTVREYIKNACKKLGVYTKNHAVVKAIMLGLIKPNL